MLSWINKVLLFLSLIVSVATLSIFINWFTYEKPMPTESVEKENLLKTKNQIKQGDTFQIKKLVINLPSRPGRLRFLETGIHFVPFHNSDIKILEDHEFILRDTVIDIAGKMSGEQLNTVSGKIILEEKLVNQVNLIFKRSIIKELYFSAFIVQ
jgi:flagellar protein FliL